MKFFFSIVVIILISFMLSENVQADANRKGRMGYIAFKPYQQLHGEIIAIRDSFLVLMPAEYTTDRDILRHSSELVVFPQSKIQYMKLAEFEPKNTYKFGVIGLVLGGLAGIPAGIPANNSNDEYDYLKAVQIAAIGTAIGLLLGKIIDVSKYAPEEVFYPTELGLEPLVKASRYIKSEPAEISRIIDQLIFEKLEELDNNKSE